jgi:DNA invertase Pin-like site-specific DNA recombinase
MSEASKKKRAVLYLRVSSRSQVDTDYDPEGNSIPAQRKACLRKAEELGMEVVEEYVEPGRSAMTVDGRPKFQEMMARVRNSKDVDAIVVYARSRMHRDTTDAAITRRELRKLGVQLVSIMDYTEDSYIGDLVAAILDGVNEYQSRASGADVAYKMAAKASRGGIPGIAPLGYLNVGERIDGREVRTVAVDAERAPFVVTMFKLYATGRYGFKDLQRAVTEAGLRTRPRKDVPNGRPVTIETIGRLLRDRRYLGRVVFQGQGVRRPARAVGQPGVVRPGPGRARQPARRWHSRARPRPSAERASVVRELPHAFLPRHGEEPARHRVLVLSVQWQGRQALPDAQNARRED